jgi:hypothetical protein
MMMDDKKKRITTIIARLGKPSEEAPKNEMGDEIDDSMPKEAAAEELLAAIESKSPKGIIEAFESLMELCERKDESSEQE